MTDNYDYDAIASLFMKTVEANLEMQILMLSPNEHYTLQTAVRNEDGGLFITSRYEGYEDAQFDVPNGDVRHAHMDLDKSSLLNPIAVVANIIKQMFLSKAYAPPAYNILENDKYFQYVCKDAVRESTEVSRENLLGYIGHVATNECDCRVCQMVRPMVANIADQLRDTAVAVAKSGMLSGDVTSDQLSKILCREAPVSDLEWAVVRLAAVVVANDLPMTGAHLQEEIRRVDPGYSLPDYEQKKRQIISRNERVAVFKGLKGILYAAVRPQN